MSTVAELEKIAYYVETHWKGAGLKLEADWILKELAARSEAREKAEEELDTLRARLARVEEAVKELAAWMDCEGSIYSVDKLPPQLVKRINTVRAAAESRADDPNHPDALEMGGIDLTKDTA